MIVAVLGFGKSFLSWNLAGCVPNAEIYADSRAPYRAWNRAVRVVERAEALQGDLILVDHEEPAVTAERLVFSAAPDPFSISRALDAKRQSRVPCFLILNGYVREAGVPWPFPAEFDPVVCIPWDERSVGCPKVGKPLTMRDPAFRARFLPLMEAMGVVDLGGHGGRPSKTDRRPL